MKPEAKKPAHRQAARQPDSLGIESVRGLESPAEARQAVSVLLDIIEEAAPLPPSHRRSIRYDVLDLWRDLTSERALRQADYIGEPAKYAAYLRYFLPWNVVRLVPILAGLELPAGDFSMLDIGSGPLTLPIALWIARPDLRDRRLRIHCSDRVRRVMDAGLTILDGLRLRLGSADSWSIELTKNIFPARSEDDRQQYDLVCAANVFNESFWRDKSTLGERADQLSQDLTRLLAADGRLLLVEPGDPRSGSMLSAIRESIILANGSILGPCTHHRACPMPGVFMSSAYREENLGQPPITPLLMPKGRHKMPWCHFVLDGQAAPDRLLQFSEAAGLPKDRLVASWLYAKPDREAIDEQEAPTPAHTAGLPRPHGSASWPKRSLRIVSDAFRLGQNGYGRYACGRSGYLLVTGQLARLPSGSQVILTGPLPDRQARKDPKSGAIIVEAGPGEIRNTEPETALPRPAPRRPGVQGRKPAGYGSRRPDAAGHKPGQGRPGKPAAKPRKKPK